MIEESSLQKLRNFNLFEKKRRNSSFMKIPKNVITIWIFRFCFFRQLFIARIEDTGSYVFSVQVHIYKYILAWVSEDTSDIRSAIVQRDRSPWASSLLSYTFRPRTLPLSLSLFSAEFVGFVPFPAGQSSSEKFNNFSFQWPVESCRAEWRSWWKKGRCRSSGRNFAEQREQRLRS